MFRPTTLFATSTILGLVHVTLAFGQTPTLTVYTYESFAAEWGPGPQVEKAFETQCACDLKFIAVADGVALLNRLRLEAGRTDADIVLGLDTNLTTEAAATGYFAPHETELSALAIPGGWDDPTFVPFDFGFFAVVYDSEVVTDVPSSMEAFLAGDPSVKIAIQDPRTSTPGLGLMLWLKALYGDEAPAAYEKLAQRVLTVTPGWSEAYGLFTNGEVPMVLSYTTSPAYHRIAEGSDRYKAAEFSEGHYMQVEVAGMTTKGAENPLARQFLDFVVSPAFQDIIPETNWMLPSAATSKPLNPVFGELVQPKKAIALAPAEIAANRREWIDEWIAAFSR